MNAPFHPTVLIKILQSYPATQRLWLAYSGGLDSHVLLQSLVLVRSQLALELRAIHIHHGLHPQADQWANHCQQICQTLNVPCDVIRVKVRTAARESLEANARTARYEAIAQLLSANDLVLTAQHADDQAETVLLQLLRGAGVAGLAAMPAISRLGNGWLGRPLLAYTRAELQTYALQTNLQWIEDDSNTDTRFDRNFLRHQIIPLLQARWPHLSQTLNRVASHQAEANELTQYLAARDLATCQADATDELILSALKSLTLSRQRNVLRHWFKKLSLPLPDTVQLQHILTDVVNAKFDRQPVVRWHGGEVRRYQDRLFAMLNLPSFPKNHLSQSWKLPQPISLPLGRLTTQEMSGQGLALPAGTELQICFRQGGEQFHWHGHRRLVKKLLQASQLPPWQRAFLPLIYFNQQLVAIPMLGIATGFEAQASEKGWIIRWELNS
jgi:tRNA(Ile)-lysidine synthase